MAKRIRNKRLERERLVVLSIPLVKQIARHVGKSVPRESFPIEDLEGAGYLGLVQASQRFRFEPQPGDIRAVEERFKAYARRRIEGEIRESTRRKNWIEAMRPHLEDMGAGELKSRGAKEPPPFIDPRQHPETIFAEREARQRIEASMDLLDDREHTVIMLQIRKEMPFNAIAKRIGASPAKVSEISRAAKTRMYTRLKIAA